MVKQNWFILVGCLCVTIVLLAESAGGAKRGNGRALQGETLPAKIPFVRVVTNLKSVQLTSFPNGHVEYFTTARLPETDGQNARFYASSTFVMGKRIEGNGKSV